MSWGVFPDGKTGLSSLLDPLLESSSLDPLWSLLCLTLYWSLLHLTFSGVFFAWPSTGVFFTWPSLESPFLDSLLSLLVWVSLGLSYLLVCVCLSAVSMSMLCPVLFVVFPVCVCLWICEQRFLYPSYQTGAVLYRHNKYWTGCVNFCWKLSNKWDVKNILILLSHLFSFLLCQ
jgi:hypothetical protein